MAKDPSVQSIPIDQCVRLVEATAKTCPAQTVVAETRKDPDFDRLSAALAAQANAFSFGALLLGTLGVFGAIAWG